MELTHLVLPFQTLFFLWKTPFNIAGRKARKKEFSLTLRPYLLSPIYENRSDRP